MKIRDHDLSLLLFTSLTVFVICDLHCNSLLLSFPLVLMVMLNCSAQKLVLPDIT